LIQGLVIGFSLQLLSSGHTRSIPSRKYTGNGDSYGGALGWIQAKVCPEGVLDFLPGLAQANEHPDLRESQVEEHLLNLNWDLTVGEQPLEI